MKVTNDYRTKFTGFLRLLIFSSSTKFDPADCPHLEAPMIPQFPLLLTVCLLLFYFSWIQQSQYDIRIRQISESRYLVLFLTQNISQCHYCFSFPLHLFWFISFFGLLELCLNQLLCLLTVSLPPVSSFLHFIFVLF